MWLWLLLVMVNLLALLLLIAGLRERQPERLLRLRTRARLLAFGAGAAMVVLLLVGAVELFRALRQRAVDPAQTARVMAEGIAGAMPWFAFGAAMLPLPVASAMALALRSLPGADREQRR